MIPPLPIMETPCGTRCQPAEATGPFTVQAELMYQPIGYRWAHNLAPYKADEPQRMVRYYEGGLRKSALVLAHAER